MPIGKPCGEPLCPQIAELGHRYCAKHEQLNPSHNFRRDSRGKDPFYDSKQWRALRQTILAANPICELCDRNPATVVHHKKRLKEFPELALDQSNLQAVCSPCHNRESQQEKTNANQYRDSFR